MSTSILCQAQVVSNNALCREHFRMTLAVKDFPSASAGQFIQIHPIGIDDQYKVHEWLENGERTHTQSTQSIDQPLLPRAFSIGGFRRGGDTAEIDVIYRVVGVATTWMASLARDDKVEILGPLGRSFPIHREKREAWLVAGGVGLPPLLWLSEQLRVEDTSVTAFLGCASRELIPLTLTGEVESNATKGRHIAEEFAVNDVPIVISTDDGSFGFGGNIVEALRKYHVANHVANRDLVIYTCGPERMMRAVADFCIEHDICGYVCMERPMACGTGTCQSCIVTVRTDHPPRQRYALCCTEGPVFPAESIIWDA